MADPTPDLRCLVCGKEAVAHVDIRYHGGSRFLIQTCGNHPLALHALNAQQLDRIAQIEGPEPNMPRVGLQNYEPTPAAALGSLRLAFCAYTECEHNAAPCMCTDGDTIMRMAGCERQPDDYERWLVAFADPDTWPEDDALTDDN